MRGLPRGQPAVLRRHRSGIFGAGTADIRGKWRARAEKLASFHFRARSFEDLPFTRREALHAMLGNLVEYGVHLPADEFLRWNFFAFTLPLPGSSFGRTGPHQLPRTQPRIADAPAPDKIFPGRAPAHIGKRSEDSAEMGAMGDVRTVGHKDVKHGHRSDKDQKVFSP